MLIVGLGNPGAEYRSTRHNIGFRAVELLADRLNFSWKTSLKFKAEVAAGNFANQKIILVKPNTYMNLSGESISIIKEYYNIPIADVVVLHDELDIKLGVVKYKQAGGSAGHNGIKSLDQHIGNNYHRIRIGIGRPEHSGEVSSYVLSKFSKEDELTVAEVLENIASQYKLLLQKDFTSIV